MEEVKARGSGSDMSADVSRKALQSGERTSFWKGR